MDANSVQMILVVVKFMVGCGLLCPLAVARAEYVAWRNKQQNIERGATYRGY